MEDLTREVPVVERLGGVDALVALQADQRQVERLGQSLGQRRLAGAGLALEQQRALHGESQVGDRGQLVVAQVARSPEQARHVGGRGHLPVFWHASRLLAGLLAPGWMAG